jgi:hypothetical protein
VTEARGGGKSGRAMQVVARLHAAPPRHNAGAEWMAWSMFRALVERGHDVTVWLSRYGEDHEPYELDGVKVIPLESRLDFATAVRRASVLVSHLETVKPTAALARGYGKPFVAICHNTFTTDVQGHGVWWDRAGGVQLAVDGAGSGSLLRGVPEDDPPRAVADHSASGVRRGLCDEARRPDHARQHEP